jgi:site-specific DNA recombinase
MTDGCSALYARVSSESQVRDHTIASQIAALRERIASDGWQLEPDQVYVDEGYSGASLLRPALERLRDAVAAGMVERVYVQAPDRLARRYAHQVLLIEEFRRIGVEIVFLNRPIGGTAEDDLLLQVQGMIAEYERAKILERSRRGRRHTARSGSVSAFTAAPFGYRYVTRDHGGGMARFEVMEEEAEVVRRIFAWVGRERLSLREVCRRLDRAGDRTRHGSTRWYASTLHGMLTNPAYIGRAVFGRSRFLPARPRLRPIRGHPRPSPRPTLRVPVPREEWIEVPVPALVEPELFEAARAQFEENRRRKRERQRGPRWLLQGLTVCRRCGYAYYGKTAPRSGRDLSRGELRYYRCIGADGYRFGGTAVCDNRPVRGDRLEQTVWDQVRTLLQDPSQVADEYRRRICQARDGVAAPAEIVRLEGQIATLQRGIGRLIDSYTEGVIDKAEFEPRISGLKARLAGLQERRRAALETAEAERDLSLVIGQLDDFAAKVSQGLDGLDWLGRREIIRALVRRIEMDHDSVEVVFRVPPPQPSNGPFRPAPSISPIDSRQHCTGGGGTDLRLVRTLSPAR